MSLYPQGLLDVHDKLIVDLFAGGGGASSGIEQALGRMVDIAVNHNAKAVAMHQANHPQTKHLISDVFEVDPRQVTDGRPVGLLWASPDCTFHSKARGAKPIRSATKKRRALAWVVTRWAGQVRPDVIFLENVEEFAQWGPLVGAKDQLRPCPKRRGKTFRAWVKSLTDLGYQVEWRELRACDYGAPTIRKRLFLIARCDGQPIVWPEPTHGPGRAHPYRTAAECIDWSIPMLSIFATKDEAKAWGKAHGKSAPIRPLAENTMRRIARGVKRFVLDNPKPFLVTIAHGEGTAGRAAPLGVVAGFLAQNNEGFYDGAGRALDDSAPTICASGSTQSLVATHIQRDFGQSVGHKADSPIGTITADRNGHAAVVASFLAKYYGEGTGQSVTDPMHTIPTVDRFGLVTVEIDGVEHFIDDIAMRMLNPRELYRCQGFRPDYIIDRGADGQKLTASEQVHMCGNSVSPYPAEKLVAANCSHLKVRELPKTSRARRAA